VSRYAAYRRLLQGTEHQEMEVTEISVALPLVRPVLVFCLSEIHVVILYEVFKGCFIIQLLCCAPFIALNAF
jgi:hypothetical protein